MGDTAPWRIRRASSSEARRLTRLAHEAKAHWGYPASWLETWVPQLTITPDYIDQHRVTIAYDNEEIVGMCALEDHADHWMLEHVWVEPLFQRRGVGRGLVGDALDTARRLRAVPVRLVADPHARGFYERLGARLLREEAAPMEGDPGRTVPHMEFDVR